MDNDNALIIGYDIGNEFTQISCLVKKLTEPEPVSQHPGSKAFMIPTALYLKDSTKEWLYGEDADKHKNSKNGIYVEKLLKRLGNNESITADEIQPQPITPEYLIEKFFARTLSMLRQKYLNSGLAVMAVTSRELNVNIRKILYDILEKLGLNKDRVRIFSYMECFMYYVLSQKHEIWTNDVALFDYSEDGLKYYQMTIGRKIKPSPVIVDSYDLSNEFSYSLLKEEGAERMKYRFEDITSKLLHKRLISALYFTGPGFDGSWSDDVLKKLCSGRRVFKGQNLYTKGACYAAKAVSQGGMKGFFFLSEEQITGTISLRAFKDSKDADVIFAKAGDYYYEIDNTINVILDNENTLDFTIKSLIRKDEIHAFYTLYGLPFRENKTICLSINLRFEDRYTAVIKVKDIGFGSMYKTNYRIWEFRCSI